MKCQKWFIINKSKIIILSDCFELSWYVRWLKWALEYLNKLAKSSIMSFGTLKVSDVS